MQFLAALSIAAPILAATASFLSSSGTSNKRADTWGGSVSLGPTKSTIIHAVTTIIPGTAP